MLEQLLPPSVAVAESREDIVDAPLFPEEEAIVSRAVEKRRREFTTARACARSALAELIGAAPGAILAGPRGEPCWPEGVVGSITHCEGFRGCAVARASALATIGIDAELDAPLPDGLLADIALPEERERLRVLGREQPGLNWDRLLFSAKESVYKAWFPLAGRWLGFEDADLTLEPRRGSFEARLLVPGPVLGGVELSGFSGRWAVQGGIVATAISLPASVAR